MHLPAGTDLFWRVVIEVNIGGTVDRKYYMPALEVVDRSTFKRLVVHRRSATKLDFQISVAESTLRSMYILTEIRICPAGHTVALVNDRSRQIKINYYSFAMSVLIGCATKMRIFL